MTWLKHNLPWVFIEAFGTLIEDRFGPDMERPRTGRFWLDMAPPRTKVEVWPVSDTTVASVFTIQRAELRFAKDSHGAWWVQPVTKYDEDAINKWVEGQHAVRQA